MQNGRGKLWLVGTVAGIVSAVLSSFSTVVFLQARRDLKIAELQSLKDSVAGHEKALAAHVKDQERLASEHSELVKQVPAIAERTINLMTAVGEVKGQLSELGRKIDRLVERGVGASRVGAAGDLDREEPARLSSTRAEAQKEDPKCGTVNRFAPRSSCSF